MYDRLDAFVLAMSQHYRILREVIGRSHGSVPYPSVQDARAADMIASMMENIGGCGLANFCRLRFRKAYLSGDCRVYDVRKVLEIIMASSKNEEFKALLKSRMNSLIELVDRLSTPISSHTKKRRSKERNSGKLVQMMLFPELEEKHADANAEDSKEKPKKQRKPRKSRKPNSGNHKDRPRSRRNSKIDKLADEILEAEYGNDGGPQAERDDEEDFEDKRPVDDDVCDYYSRGYSRMRGSDYDYFSGGYYND